MKEYKKPAIAGALQEIEAQYSGWRFTLLQPFPSLTIALKQEIL
jgi:hypothetical protein